MNESTREEDLWDWCQWCGKRFKIDIVSNPDRIPICDDCEDAHREWCDNNENDSEAEK